MDLTARPSASLAGFSLSASLLLHAGTIAVVIVALGPRSTAPGPMLPVLMLYAPDRRPIVPRDLQMPLGAPLGSSDVPSEWGDRALGSRPTEGLRPKAERLGAAPLPGLLPSGPVQLAFDSVYSVLAVDSQVVRDPETVAPRYPTSLLEAGVQGIVVVEFVVDSTGRVDLSTVQVLNSSHPEFTAAVEAALAEMKFRPAWRAFRHVRQLVQQRFSFELTLANPLQPS